MAGILETLWRIGQIVLALYLGVIAIAYLVQRKLQYFPDPERVPPASVGLRDVEEVVLSTPDGHSIVAWWTPPRDGRPTVLYFHGNGGNVSYRAPRVGLFQSIGFGALMMTYRGYGGSSGRPSEASIIADATLAYDWLRSRGLGPERIVLFGESLGSGVAIQLAASRPVAGIVLDSPFSSVPDAAAHHYPFLPVRWLLTDRYDSMAHIGRINAPLLIVHGDADPVVPHALGRKLFEAANEPKQHVTLPGEGHTVPLANGAWRTVRPFLEGLAANTGRPN